jgi:hypothetical protein
MYGPQGKLIGLGSGFILTPDGLAATKFNFHVLENAYRAEAELGDGRLFQVLRVQTFDRERDLALFRLGRQIGQQIEWPSDLQRSESGNSTDIHVATEWRHSQRHRPTSTGGSFPCHVVVT